jgi:uncharacterized protein (UPF0333 family)
MYQSIKNKKAQVSLEILIIVGVLIIGAIVFGLIFLSNMNKADKDDISEITTNVIDDFKKEMESNYCDNPNPPIFDKPGGQYENDFYLTISSDCPENSYEIYYTTNNSSPTSSSSKYVSPLHIETGETTIKAIVYAYDSNSMLVTSSITTENYEVES